MSLSLWYRPLLLIILAGLTVPHLKMVSLGPNSILLKDLVHGNQMGYSSPGDTTLRSLRAKLPPQGVFSYITDASHKPEALVPEKFLIAQNYLAPRILTSASGQKIAIVDCSSSTEASRKVAEAGYQLIYSDLDTGQGLAIRQV